MFLFPWRRAWQTTLVLLPGESHGQRTGRLQSIGSHRARHDWSNLACMHAHVFFFFLIYFLNVYFKIYFWLCWVFVATRAFLWSW